MRISATISYAATPDEVFAMLTDEEFQRRKCERTGALNQSVKVTERDGGAVVVTKRTLPTASFPDFVRGMVGETIIVTETTTWQPAGADGARTGTLVVDLGGSPIGVAASVDLRAGGTGTTEVVEGDLRARIPLVGGKIEKAAQPAVEAAIRAEEEVGTAWLAAR